MAAKMPGVTVHPHGLCESGEVGAGTRIWAFAHVMGGARIGRDCNIGDHAFIESGAWLGDRVTVKNAVLIWDGVRIEDDAFVGPAVVFTNDRVPRSPRMPVAAVTARYARRERWLVATRVGRGASIGARAVIAPGITLGDYCMIGAGCVVVRDVPAHRAVSRRHPDGAGWVCVCGERLAAGAGGCWRCACGATFRPDDRGGLEATDSEAHV
jgi:acetyltransferase-like isoleucine patch superfamily enzyme